MVSTNSTTPSALAAPQFTNNSMFDTIFIDTMITLPPPSTAGVTKEPKAQHKDHQRSGKQARRGERKEDRPERRVGLAPRFDAAFR